jgi:hypothetical protein
MYLNYFLVSVVEIYVNRTLGEKSKYKFDHCLFLTQEYGYSSKKDPQIKFELLTNVLN